MRTNLSAYLNNAITALIIAVVTLTPLFFLPLTTEFFDTPKLILISVAVLVLLVLWSLTWVIQGKVSITRTLLDLPLLLILVVVILSSIFSDTRYISILGNFPRIHGSAISWVSYILFYFVLVSNLRTTAQVKAVYYGLLLSSAVVALISLAAYFGFFLPFAFTKVVNFTTTGSSFSSAALLALLLPLPLISLVKASKFASLPLSLGLSVLFGITLALIGDLASLVAAVLAVGLVLYTHQGPALRKILPFLAIPVLISVLVFAASMLPLSTNVLSQLRNNFPKEIQLPFTTSWKVSASSFRDTPFLGTGPGSYLFNYTAYKPIDVNNTNLWNIRFDQAFNEYLQILGTLGGLGLLSLLFLTAMILGFGWRGLNYHQSENSHNLVVALSISAILSIVLLALHISTPVLMVVVLTLLAMLMALNKAFSVKVEELSIGIKASKLTDSNLIVGDVLPIILFIPILVLVAIALWNGSKMVLADYHHRLALNSASSKAVDTYNELVQAENLNPYVDLYRTDLAQTNFALANAIASAKGPTQASPSGSLTDQDKTNIQQLLSQSINEARVATVLSPKSAQNLEILASIYRQISGVAQNALQFALDSRSEERRVGKECRSR